MQQFNLDPSEVRKATNDCLEILDKLEIMIYVNRLNENLPTKERVNQEVASAVDAASVGINNRQNGKE